MEPISGVSGLPSALKIQGRGVGGHQWAGLGQGEESSGRVEGIPPKCLLLYSLQDSQPRQCRIPALWEGSGCWDLNGCPWGLCINHSGDPGAGGTSGGGITQWLPLVTPIQRLHPSPEQEGTQELPVFVFWSFLQPGFCSEFPGKVSGLLLITLLRHGVVQSTCAGEWSVETRRAPRAAGIQQNSWSLAQLVGLGWLIFGPPPCLG